MPNINRNMLFFLLITTILTTGDCFLSSMIDQPLKLAVSLFGQKGRNSAVAPVATPQVTPQGHIHNEYPSAVNLQPNIRPVPPQNMEPYRPSNDEPWKSYQPEHGPMVEPWTDRSQHAEPLASRHRSPVKASVEPWKDSAGHKPYNLDEAREEARRIDRWRHSVDASGDVSWSRHRLQGKIQPPAEPLKESTEDIPWRQSRPDGYMPQPPVRPLKESTEDIPWRQSRPDGYMPKPRVEPLNDDQRDRKPWQDDTLETYPRPKQNRHRIDGNWNLKHSGKYYSAKTLQIIPGRVSDSMYDGWDKRLMSELSVKNPLNVIPIPLPDRVSKNRQWEESGERDDHVIHAKVEAEASGRSPIVSMEEIPDMRSGIVIITSKPIRSHAKRTYHHTGYIRGLQNRAYRARLPVNRKDCVWCY